MNINKECEGKYMTEKAFKLLAKINDLVDEVFPGFDKFCIEETVLKHKLYRWAIRSNYMVAAIAFDDLNYIISAMISVNMEEEDGENLIEEEFVNLEFNEFKEAVNAFMKKHKNRISAAKYLAEAVEKNEREEKSRNFAIDFVNNILDEG